MYIFFSSNVVLSASKIQERHQLVVSTIGAFAEEQKAFDLMSGLIWQLPLFMAVAALIDLLLVVVYMNWLHPWRGILEDVSRNLSSNLYHYLPQGPEIWGPLSDEEGALEVPIQTEGHENMLMKSLSKKVSIHSKMQPYKFPTVALTTFNRQKKEILRVTSQLGQPRKFRRKVCASNHLLRWFWFDNMI